MSHGIPRGSGVQPATAEDRQKELQRIKDYKGLVESVHLRIQERQYTIETLDLTTKLLRWNPEYYTIWNHRRLIMRHILSLGSGEDGQVLKTSYDASVNIISDELSFLLPLMRKYPKCYWIWKYRLWLLEQSTHCLPVVAGRQLWQQELALASKMLSLDSRNFHGWGYRRTVVNALESPELQSDGSASPLTEQEFDYTTKMINTNLSNFSAWHTRSKLIPKVLTEKQADKVARRKFLDEELELIQRALWAGSEDQSLWFYHQNLMSTFDPKYAADSMAPDLSGEERLEYVTQEIGRIQEMLDGAEDCKWIYQSLISLSILDKSLSGKWPVGQSEIGHWVDELAKLDPLRANRWADLRRELEAP